jgi:putative peptidoglycan lipid II flippase
MAERKTLLRTAGSISLATLVSRVLGLARDQVQSYYFGAGAATDAFVAAFRIPNLLRDLFAEGALSSAFVPTFTAERERLGREAAWRLANRVVSALALILGALTLLLALMAPQIVPLYAPGFDAEKTALAVTMTRILSPFLLCVALAAVAMGILNTCGRFFLPAVAPAAFNLAAIVGVVALSPLLPRFGLAPVLSLAIGAMAGGLLQLLVQIPALGRQGYRFRLDVAFRDPGLRRIGTLMLPAVFGLAATQINILVDTILASKMGDGPPTWLSIAFRLMQLPLGLFGVAIATANLARVSQDVARRDHDALRASLAGALRAAALLTLPATAGLLALARPIVRVLFEHGRFDAADTEATALAVACYALGLYAYSVTKIQVPTYYALGDTRRPVVASALSVAAKIGANFILIALLRRLGAPVHLALALSTSLAAWLNFAQLGVGLRRSVGSMAAHAVASTTWRLAALSVAVGGAAWGVHRLLERAWTGEGTAVAIVRLAAGTSAGLAVWAGGLAVLRLPEAEALWRRLRRPAP